MKRFLALMTAFFLIFSSAALAGAEQPVQLKIVATTFPVYDWLRNILGSRLESAELTLLQDSGVDLHNYQPTAQDIVKLSEADLFVYVGGESDDWVADAIKSADNSRLVSVSLLDVLGGLVKNEVVVEGMQEDEHDHEHEEAEHEHEDDEADHDHDEDDHDEADHEHEGHDHEHGTPDEHVWLSLRNAQTAVTFLTDMLAALDGENAAIYEANAEAYLSKLRELDEEYTELFARKKDPTVLFADRFPFRYLMDDYGIRYYAAFAGCSAETEASFATVAFLAGKINDLNLPAVLTIDGSDQKVARTVIENSARQVELLSMHSMQTITRADIEAGAEYLSLMQHNLEVLQQAL